MENITFFSTLQHVRHWTQYVIYTEIVARVAKYKLNCVANGAFDVERTIALTKIGFAFKYYFRHETRKAKMRCPTGREINSTIYTVTIIDRCSVRVEQSSQFLNLFSCRDKEQ